MQKPLFLLVYPQVPDTYWSYKHALQFVGKKALMPPLGLATIAAMIPETYDIRIIDLNVERLPTKLLERASLVLISAMIVQADSMKKVIARCRAAGVSVAAGGPYVTSCHGSIEGIDHAILGEAEQTFPEFLADFGRGRAQRVYECDNRPELSLAPVPRFDLLELRYYDSIPLQFSRGCPYDCEFCDIVSLFGHRARTKSPQQFIRELGAAYETGFRGSIFVVDDNFIGNRRAVKALLRSMIVWQTDHGFPFKFCTEASIDLATDQELMDLMVASRFNMVFVGIETPEPESLAAAGKLQNLRQDLVASVRTIQERGIEVTGGFIIGFDSDTTEIFDLQIDFIRRLAIPTAMVGLLMALPNTRLHERLTREGRMVSDASGNNTHIAALNFVPRMSRELLEEGYYRVLRTIYSPRVYFERCLEVLGRYPDADRSTQLTRKIRFREIIGLGNSILRQLFSGYGLAYLSYMVRALKKRPSLIVTIVTMSIQGHHYFTITRRVLRDLKPAPAQTVKLRRSPIGAAARDTIPLIPGQTATS